MTGVLLAERPGPETVNEYGEGGGISEAVLAGLAVEFALAPAPVANTESGIPGAPLGPEAPVMRGIVTPLMMTPPLPGGGGGGCIGSEDDGGCGVPPLFSGPPEPEGGGGGF